MRRVGPCGVRLVAVLLLFGLPVHFGCGKTGPAVDVAPFEAAIGDYLRQNGMALKIKAVREGPDIVGDSATLSASMTHEELAGASTVWRFSFEKRADGGWTVVRHDPQ